MSRQEREVVLGAIVFVALVIAVVGTLWLSERFTGAAGGYRLHVLFDSVPGLQRGNHVTVRGYKVGKVLGIGLSNGVPVVTLGFSELDRLPRDSHLYLKSDGLLGGQMIELQLGSSGSAFYADGDTLAGEPGADLEQLINNAIGISGNVDAALQDLVGRDNLDRVDRILSEIDSSTSELKASLEENRGSLRGAILSLETVSADAQGVLGDNRPDVRSAVQNLKRASERMEAVSTSFDSTSASLQAVLSDLRDLTGRLRRGEGTLGLLLQDEGVYRDLRRTLSSVDSLVAAIKREPDKYLKVDFSVF